MIRRFRTALTALVVGIALVSAAAPVANAIDLFPACTTGGNGDTSVCKATGSDKVDSLAQNITKLLLWAIGVVAVIMLVIGGFKYVTSNGDSNQIHSAKNTVLYAVIGLAVAILGQVIVTYVITWF